MQLSIPSSQSVAATHPTCPSPPLTQGHSWRLNSSKQNHLCHCGPAVPGGAEVAMAAELHLDSPLLHCEQETLWQHCSTKALGNTLLQFLLLNNDLHPCPSFTLKILNFGCFFSTASTNANTTQVPAFRKLIIPARPPKYLNNTWGKKMVRKQRSSYHTGWFVRTITSHKFTGLSLVKHKTLPTKFCNPFPQLYKLFKVVAWLSSFPENRKKIHTLLKKLLWEAGPPVFDVWHLIVSTSR